MREVKTNPQCPHIDDDVVTLVLLSQGDAKLGVVHQCHVVLEHLPIKRQQRLVSRCTSIIELLPFLPPLCQLPHLRRLLALLSPLWVQSSCAGCPPPCGS